MMITINKAYKTRIYPTKEQAEFINRTIGACRYVYNHMLSRQIKVYERRDTHLSRYEMQNLLPVMKGYLPWLKETDSHALQYACSNLDNAYKEFFKEHSGFPKYKSKHSGHQSYTTEHPTTVRWEPKRVKLPKLGYVKTRDKRQLPDNAKVCNATVSKEGDKYYVSICFKYEADIIEKDIIPDKAVGLDFKVSNLYVDSNNERLDFPTWYQDSLYKLKLEQRKLKHKQGCKKGQSKSNRYLHQQSKINNLHHHIRNQRYDFLHKQSTAITKRYNVICIEDISIKDMYIDDKDKTANKQKHNINRSYANDGWYMFTQMMTYKASYSSGIVVKVPKDYPSSEICHCCGYRNPKLKDISIREWTCPQCNVSHDRDYNAAVNIKNKGLEMLKATA